MGLFKDWPAALQRRWLLLWSAGAAFLLVGLAVFIALRDMPLLIISILLALCTGLRCVAVYRVITAGSYAVVSGVCIGLGHAGLKKHWEVRLLQTDGAEYTVKLDKRLPLRIGNCYRFYFQRPPAGETPAFNAYLEDSQLLGFEDLGEYHADKNFDEPEQNKGDE